ncbi:ABC transporter permease [Bacillaceae bacterium W0354]
MMKNLLVTEFLKIKRKGFWFLTVLGPFGVVALQMVNYGYRKEYLLRQSDNDWLYYVQNVSGFTPLAVVLGIVILTSFMASIENETNSWKQLIALPISKWSVYLSKFTVLISLFLLSSLLLTIFSLLYGLSLDLGDEIPYLPLIKNSFYPFLAAVPILALQLWVATISQNQAIPTTLGIIGFILTYSSYELPDWLIWKWPLLINEWNEPMINVWLGLVVGMLLYVIGMFDFMRRDVK